MTALIYFFVFYFAAIVGSGLNVFVKSCEKKFFKTEENIKSEKRFYKKDLKKSLTRRSACPSCNKELSPKELFPIFSYLFQKGKCSSCKTKISTRYLFVELISGFSFLLIFNYFYALSLPNNEFIFNTIFFFLITCTLISIFIFDLNHKIIPNKSLYALLPLVVLYLLGLKFIFNYDINIFHHFFKSLFLALPFFMLWLLSRGRAIGFADWKFIFILSLLFTEYSKNITFIFNAFWLGLIFVIIISAIEKKLKLNAEVAFGPFLIMSFYLVYFSNFNAFIL